MQAPTLFEEQYLGVLHSIETAISAMYRTEPHMMDYDALDAVNGLIRKYQAEQKQRPASQLRLQSLAQQTYDAVDVMCEIHLGRRMLTTHSGEPLSLGEPTTIAEMVACLKRIRKSIEKWNKEGGQRGYLNFISEFV